MLLVSEAGDRAGGLKTDPRIVCEYLKVPAHTGCYNRPGRLDSFRFFRDEPDDEIEALPRTKVFLGFPAIVAVQEHEGWAKHFHTS